ncbi:MAG: carboxypeptidase regulatory-like domain-containing protein [Bryobacteraceae bacterium]|nr:carboxypeptidase regulatory-like domain-containing protein [Bryobacteraceae bacterium]
MRQALLMLLPALLFGQYPPDPKARGSIEGTVVDHSTGRALRRAQVVLRPASKILPSLGTSTDDAGRFTFSDLPSGRYSVIAKHPGYLHAYFANLENTRLPAYFPLLPGERLDQVAIRMRPAGVISGTVQFSDAEPAIGVPVELYREFFYRGQHGYEKAGTAHTDDRGAYRIYGLPPGEYYLAVAYSRPDPGAGVREQTKLDSNGIPEPEESFVVTYYPSTPKLLEASLLKLEYGSVLDHTDVILTKARTVRVRGRVVSGVSGRGVPGASLRLRQRAPAGEAMVDAPAAIRSTPEGFEITGLTPGAYLIVADGTEGRQKLTGRMPLSVSEASVGNVELVLNPYPQLTGTVSSETGEKIDLSGLTVSLEPHDDATRSSSTSVDAKGAFSLPFVPGETYDVFLTGDAPDLYLKSARVGGFDVLSTGFKAGGGALPPMELIFTTRSGAVQGDVIDGPTRVALGATVVLIPDPAYGRVQHYQAASTNEYGLFEFRGVAPGRYTMASWWDDPPCEIYDVEGLDACRRYGQSILISEGERQFVSVPLSPSQE